MQNNALNTPVNLVKYQNVKFPVKGFMEMGYIF